MTKKILAMTWFGWLFALLSGCVAPITAPTDPLHASTLLPPSATFESSIPTPVPPTSTPTPLPDLSHRPLIWFGPLDPSPPDASRPFSGRPDFFNLFTEDARWTNAAQHVDVFKLYGGWVAWTASDAELRQVIGDLNRRGIAIAFEAGGLTPSEACTGEIEGFAGQREGIRIAQRIKAAGGIVRFVEDDHAYDAGRFSDASGECLMTPEEIAQDLAGYVEAIRNIFPDVIVGDIITAQLDVNEVRRWVEAYRATTGEDLGFIHLDVPWDIPNWPQKVKEIEDYLHSQEIEFAISYIGDRDAFDDEEWLSQAGERAKAYELIADGHPDHVVFTTWHDHPDQLLPESEPYTFTWFINSYLDDVASLGFRSEGPGANIAFGAVVRASKAAQSAPENAVDGNLDTFWGAGDFAPQWIEIDLGAPYNIAEIRMLIQQTPGIEAAHQILGRGPDTYGQYVLLHTFSSPTRFDRDWLTYSPDTPWTGIEFVRVETRESPSWISFWEIEIISSE